MASIPLVDNNGRESINTSVIAIKKEIEQIEGLLQNARNKLKSLSDNDFLYRSDLTNTVESGNKNPVTSDGVANAIASEATSRDTAIQTAINALDVSSVGGSGKYISAISETDGKINATATDLGNIVPVNSVTSGNMHSVTSNAVAVAFNAMNYSNNVIKVGNFYIETVNIFLGTVTFTNGRASVNLNYNFTAPFSENPFVILNSQNDIDYGYCSVIGIIRNKTKISTLALWRNTDGTYNDIYIKGIAMGK